MKDIKRMVPKRRFKEFIDTGDWDQCKLEEVAEIIGGGTPSTNIPEYWDGDIDWYTPAELNSQIYADRSERKITKLGLEKSSAKILPACKTILFTSRAGIGKTAILKHSAATNQGFQSIIVNNDIDPYFVYSMSGKIKEKAERIASGSTFAEISGKMLGNLEFMFPTKEEQDKIGEHFFNLDNLITLHQRKLKKVKKMKEAYLSEMFPQEGEKYPRRRFAGFSDPWEQRKLGDIGEFGKRYSYSRANEGEGEYAHIHYGDIHSKYNGLITDKTKVPTIKSKSKHDTLSNGDIIIADASEDHDDLGKTLIIEDVNNRKLISGLHTFNFRPNKILNSKFYLYYTQSGAYKRFIYKKATGISVLGLSKKNIENMIFMVPSNLEQEKIGLFFSNLDNLITLHQRKLEKLENIKKAYLNEMFI